MVQRINFVEKGKYALTYKNMAIALCGWVLLCLFIYFLQVSVGFVVGQRIKSAEETLNRLNQEKDKKMAMLEMTSKQVESHAGVEGLTEYLSHVPMWSDVLQELEHCLPKSVWLTSVISENVEDGNKVKKVTISGVSISNNTVAQFVKNLNGSKMFKNAILGSLEREQEIIKEEGATEGGGEMKAPVRETAFVIYAEVHFAETKWN